MAERVGERKQVWLLAGALFAAAWLSTGYAVYIRNQALQIPLINHILDPSLYANDPFGQTLGGYAAPLWWGVAWLSRIIPLEGLLFVLFVAEKVCLLCAAAALGRAFFPKSKLAPWAGAAVAAVGIPSILGSIGKITPPYFEQTGFSIPFFLWGFACLVRGRRWHWAIFMAAGSALNIMYGVYALTYSAAAILLMRRGRAREWVAPALLWGALSVPVFLFAAQASGAAASDEGLWLSAATQRFVSHLVPLRWPVKNYLAFFLFCGLLLGFSRNREADEGAPSKGFIGAAAGCGIFWLGLAFVAMYGVREPRLLILHPARGTDFLYGAGIIYLAGYFGERLEMEGARPKILYLLGLMVSLFFLRAMHLPNIQIVGAALVLVFLHPGVMRFAQERLSARGALAVVVAVVFLFGAARQGMLWLRSGTFDIYAYGASLAEMEAAAWARENADKQAIFVVPNEMTLFRGLARRGTTGTWKDGSAMLWHRPYVEAWVERMHALGRPAAPARASRYPIAPTRYPKGWSDERILAMGERFGAEYAILPSAHASGLPRVFWGRHGYKIVRIRPAAEIGLQDNRTRAKSFEDQREDGAADNRK